MKSLAAYIQTHFNTKERITRPLAVINYPLEGPLSLLQEAMWVAQAVSGPSDALIVELPRAHAQQGVK